MKSAGRQSNERPSAVVEFDELRGLTGYSKPTYVKKWLQDRAILFFLNAHGQPVTTAKALNQALERGRKTEPVFNFGQKK